VVVVVVCFVFVCLFFVVVAVGFFSSEKPSMSENFRCTNIPLREGLQEILRNKRALSFISGEQGIFWGVRQKEQGIFLQLKETLSRNFKGKWNLSIGNKGEKV